MKKTVLITGATSGIGLELAKVFAKHHYELIIVARKKHELMATQALLQQEYKAEVSVIVKDLFNPKSARQIYDETKAQGITVDILVNNAGQGEYGDFIDASLERLLDIIQLNISSLVSLTHLYLSDMLKRGEGKILNLSSIASKTPGPGHAVYHATKAFVQSFSEAIRSEVKGKGIVITALLPGVTDTDFFNKASMNESKVVQNKDDMADPADVANDGYQALMKGEDMVISGLGNKFSVFKAAITPDETLADQTKKDQERVEKSK